MRERVEKVEILSWTLSTGPYAFIIYINTQKYPHDPMRNIIEDTLEEYKDHFPSWKI